MFIFLTFMVLLPLTIGNMILFSPVKRRDPFPTRIKADERWNITAADILKHELLAHYDKFLRPSYGNITTVKVDPTIYRVDLDEETSIMTVHCWVRMKWIDEKITWDETKYNIKELNLAAHEIWQPDLAPYNSAAGSSVDYFGNTHSLVNSKGEVLWVPPAIIQVFCDLNLKKWPFDTQTCTMRIGSWVHHRMELDLEFTKHQPEIYNDLPYAKWQIISIYAKNNAAKDGCCEEPFVYLEYTFTIRRQLFTYHAVLVTPITAIVFLTLCIFWLPSNSGEKIILGGVAAVIVTIFILYFAHKVAAMHVGQAPLIVSFYTGTLQLIGISVVVSVVVLKLSRHRRRYPLPWFLKTLLTGWLGQWLFLDMYITQHSLAKSRGVNQNDDESADNRPVLTDLSGDQQMRETSSFSVYSNDDWALLGAAIDRISFLVYCVLFVALFVAYSI